MASKALLPALALLALVCGELVTGGHAQAYIGGAMGGSPAGMRPLPYARGGITAGMQPRPPYAGGGITAGMQPPIYTTQRHSKPGNDDGTGRLSGVEEEKAFMIHPKPAARERPVPVPPTSN